MERLYKNFKELADYKRMTLTQLAVFLGLSRQTFHFRLKNQKITHLDLKRLSDYMEVPMDAFLNENPLSFLEKSGKTVSDEYSRIEMLEKIIKEKDNIITSYENIIAGYRELLSEYREKNRIEKE